MADSHAFPVETPYSKRESRVRKSAILWWRRISQLIFLSVMGQWAFYGIVRCPFMVPFVSCQNCPVITCTGRLFTLFWGIWLLIPISALFFGRAFCSWACPGGAFSQLFGYVAFFKLRIQNAFVASAAYLKYGALALSLYFLLLLDQPRIAIPIRVGESVPSVLLTFEHADRMWLIRSGLVLGFFAMGLVLANAWCRLACPMGALFETVKSGALFKVVKTKACNDCNLCLKGCEMGTRPAESNCTNCCDCLNLCPQDAILLQGPKRIDPK